MGVASGGMKSRSRTVAALLAVAWSAVLPCSLVVDVVLLSAEIS